MSSGLSSVQRVRRALAEAGIKADVIELPASTRSAVEAAAAIGCALGQICKSLVFRARQSERPLLVIASGVNHVDEKLLEGLAGEPVCKADAEFVRSHTGYSIGGVPPCAHNEQLFTVIDQDLMQYEQVWAAAGTPHAVFNLTPADLLLLSHAIVAQIHR